MVKRIDVSRMINMYNNVCRSKTKKSGKELRLAHYKLGYYVGKKIVKDKHVKNKRITIIIMMRAGLPFGMGIADSLEIKNNTVNIQFSSMKPIDYTSFDLVIFADAVLNTGRTIIKLLSNCPKEKVLIAVNVISKKGCLAMSKYEIYVARVSSHSYKGSSNKSIIRGKGPDTGDRLYNSSFFEG